MSDPIRLRDDPATPKSRQRLLGLGSSEHDLGFDDAAGLARLRGSIDSGSFVRTRASRPRMFAALVRMSRYAALPALWVWLSLPAAAAAGWWAVHHAPSVWQHLHAPAPLPSVQPAVIDPSTSPPPIPQPPGHDDETPVAADPAGVPAALPPPTPAHRGGATDEARDRLLVAETTQLAELRRLGQTDPRRAVALADEGARQFPNGFFAQEREAIAITSLLRLGRDGDARARAERFLIRYPRGPAAEKIRKAVGLPGE